MDGAAEYLKKHGKKKKKKERLVQKLPVEMEHSHDKQEEEEGTLTHKADPKQPSQSQENNDKGKIDQTKNGGVCCDGFELNASERAEVEQQLSAVDATTLTRLRELIVSSSSSSAAAPQQKTTKTTTISPFVPAATSLREASDGDRKRWSDAGLRLLREGRVAALLLAGGQGTRLGHDHPKGTYDVGLPSHASLFALQAARIRAVHALAQGKTSDGGHSGSGDNCCWWIVLTSGATHAETVAHFERAGFFGLRRDRVRFVEQGMLPALDARGRVLLEARNRVALAPNGNAGVYQALAHSGVLAELAAAGVELLYQYGVDNVLVPVCDPTFLGFVAERRAECACTCVEKTRPEEPVGVLCLRDGKPAVAEYTEISAEDRALRDPASGKLVYSAAHICVNAFSVEFLRRHALSPLPFHVAHKAVPYAAGPDGATVRPTQPNAFKAEMFIFDIFAYAERMCALLVPREECFAPLKNPPSADSDNPATCRAALFALHARWLRDAGAVVDASKSDVCEIDPAVSFAGEGLEWAKGMTIVLPAHITEPLKA